MRTGLTRLGAVLTLSLVGALVAPGTSRADDVGPVPSVGQFVYGSRIGLSFIGVVNAVRRTSGVTVLYVSVGTNEPVSAGQRRGADAFLGYGVSSDNNEATVNSSLRLTRLIDGSGGKVYRPVQTSAAPECVCTSMSKGVPQFDPTTQMVTFAAAFPALPAGVTHVDVDVTGEGFIVADVPVSDGAELTPTAGSGTAVLMGQGWPKLDLAAAAAVSDVTPFVTDLIARQSSTDNSVRSKTTTTEASIDISADVLFAVDKASLTPAATAKLAAVAAKITASAKGTVRVIGYTDDTGSVAHNQGLSERRAASVVAALRSLAPGVSFTASGRGEGDPVASNASTAGRQLNRRVSVQFATRATR